MMRRMLLRPGEDLINANAKLQGTGKGRPEASLIKFYYSKPTLSRSGLMKRLLLFILPGTDRL